MSPLSSTSNAESHREKRTNDSVSGCYTPERPLLKKGTRQTTLHDYFKPVRAVSRTKTTPVFSSVASSTSAATSTPTPTPTPSGAAASPQVIDWSCYRAVAEIMEALLDNLLRNKLKKESCYSASLSAQNDLKKLSILEHRVSLYLSDYVKVLVRSYVEAIRTKSTNNPKRVFEERCIRMRNVLYKNVINKRMVPDDQVRSSLIHLNRRVANKLNQAINS